jgi:hypothetical protein
LVELDCVLASYEVYRNWDAKIQSKSHDSRARILQFPPPPSASTMFAGLTSFGLSIVDVGLALDTQSVGLPMRRGRNPIPREISGLSYRLNSLWQRWLEFPFPRWYHPWQRLDAFSQ